MNAKILLFSITLFFSPSLWALQGTSKLFGAGFQVGSSTGINLKYWMHKNKAVDLSLSFSKNNVDLQSDFLFHKFDLIKIGKEKLTLHFGAGLRLHDKKNQKDEFGIRVPLGVNYYLKDFQTIPIDFFAELAPVFNLVSETGVDMNFYLGGRYYF